MLIQSPRWQIGLSKTGFINESGQCLVMQARLANRPVLIVLLDANGHHSRFDDANRIRTWMEGAEPASVQVHQVRHLRSARQVRQGRPGRQAHQARAGRHAREARPVRQGRKARSAHKTRQHRR